MALDLSKGRLRIPLLPCSHSIAIFLTHALYLRHQTHWLGVHNTALHNTTQVDNGTVQHESTLDLIYTIPQQLMSTMRADVRHATPVYVNTQQSRQRANADTVRLVLVRGPVQGRGYRDRVHTSQGMVQIF